MFTVIFGCKFKASLGFKRHEAGMGACCRGYGWSWKEEILGRYDHIHICIYEILKVKNNLFFETGWDSLYVTLAGLELAM